MTKWILAALAAAAVAGPAAQAEAGCTLDKFGDLPVTMEGLTPTIPLKLNGIDVRMIADSGAFFSVLTPQAAARLKLKVGSTPFGAPIIEGLGGVEETGVATVKDLTILGVTLHKADFLVAAPQFGDEVDGLLANNILSFADVEFDLASGTIRLFRPRECPKDAMLAYWAPPERVSRISIEPVSRPDFKIVVRVQVNGHPLRAILDSGAGRSFITRRAARAVGVTTDSAGVKVSDLGGGIGPRRYQTWIAPFSSFKIGDEEVKNTQLQVGDTELSGIDMLIGADFLLSHRVYVANSEHMLYFTYLGGPVFNLEQAGKGVAQPNQTPTPTPPLIAGAPSDLPTDAPSYSRRGSAFMARRDYPNAIADFTHAIQLDPTQAQPLHDRGLAHLANHEDSLALADFDAALKLKPDDVPSLMIRGRLRFAAKDQAGGGDDLQAAMKLDPKQSWSASYIYMNADMFEPAVAALDAWIVANPKDPGQGSALNQRCWARALWNQGLEQALDDCNSALRLLPGAYPVLDSRGLVNLRLGRFEEAIADYNQALKRKADLAWSLLGRGIAETKLGRTKDGEADIAAARALSPNLPGKAAQYGIAVPAP